MNSPANDGRRLALAVASVLLIWPAKYLLEWIEKCGVDNYAAQDRVGTDRACEIRSELERSIKPIGLELRPGRVEL